MIRPEPELGLPLVARESPDPEPWIGLGSGQSAGFGNLATLSFATLTTSGPDPARDRLVAIQAVGRDPQSGAFERFEGDDLVEFRSFLAGRAAVVEGRDAFRAWVEPQEDVHLLDLEGLGALFLPGRAAFDAAAVARRGDPREPAGPEELRAALGALVARILGRGETYLALLAHSFHDLWSELLKRDARAAEEVALGLRLLEHPSVWRPDTEGGHGALTDGRLSDALRAFETLEDALEHARPRWCEDPRAQRKLEPRPPYAEERTTLSSSDRAILDEIFETLLPQRFAERLGSARPTYRRGQHQVSSEIAATFGENELFLVHAPTGTGKTLAYLLPTMLWALRNNVRVGIATFTRALQEQAMEREVPLALALLERAGVGDALDVSLLKGRQNYLCWRALRQQLPPAGEAPEDLLAWTILALFGLSDTEGDLDRLSPAAPLESLDKGSALGGNGWRATLARFLRLVRAETGCCSTPGDRETCGADTARRRAERSHIVITNHAFALARREFFRHLVFDECEHLHDVAHNAFSHTLSLRELRDLLDRIYRPGSKRTPLFRIAANAVSQSPLWRVAMESKVALDEALDVLVALEDAIFGFKRWRDRQASTRQDSDTHSLFREYVDPESVERPADEDPDGVWKDWDARDGCSAANDPEALLDAQARLHRALNELSAGLAQAAEHLDTLPKRGLGRTRRALEITRSDLDEALATVAAWIPRTDGGRPQFRPETFNDLETTPRGDDVLAARVLLPHEYLGRHYYPDLKGAVLLSATTWLKGGFDAASTYLGLARAATPAEDEFREPSEVRAFQAPETFDYERVLVAVPRDAPSVRQGKRVYLDYVARFVGYLAERTRGRVLALFTNADDAIRTGERLKAFFDQRGLSFWYQRMDGTSKEELGERFRRHTESVLFGLDTFWYGADFPGPTLEHLVIVRLPYGVPDRYHQAQCAALGSAEQRRQIYMPRALAKLRQGFGRLMRRETDRGCIYLLDNRILDPRHRSFLRELPLRDALADESSEGRARFVTADTDACFTEAFAHMELTADVQARDLAQPFAGWRLHGTSKSDARDSGRDSTPQVPDISADELPF